MTKAEELKRIAEALMPHNGDLSYVVLSNPTGALTPQGAILATWAQEAARTGTGPSSSAAFRRFTDLCGRHVMQPGSFFKAFPNDARTLYQGLLEEVVKEIDQLLGDKKPDPTRHIDVDKIMRRVEERLNDDGIRAPGNLMEQRG